MDVAGVAVQYQKEISKFSGSRNAVAGIVDSGEPASANLAQHQELKLSIQPRSDVKNKSASGSWRFSSGRWWIEMLGPWFRVSVNAEAIDRHRLPPTVFPQAP